MKKIGVLAPLFCIPNRYGIGDFSKGAKRFIDYLLRIGASYWQILPLNPIGIGESPYQSISSFAFDDIYVSLPDLKNRGLIDDIELYARETITNRINYKKVRRYKLHYFKNAFTAFSHQKDYINTLEAFLISHPLVKEYATFKTLSKMNNNLSWNLWTINSIDEGNKKIYYYEVFKQYILFEEWNEIHEYAKEKNIKIIGDLPFYAGFNSQEVYFNQKSFLLDENKNPKLVAGVPPDYFSKDGQNWGNPIYDWDYLSKNNFDIIAKRILFSNQIYDFLRIDHFRAFDSYYTIPYGNKDARIGEWKYAPGYTFFDMLLKNHQSLHILAEDLGELREEVFTLRDHYHFPGMNVIQFNIVPEEINHQSHYHVYKNPNCISYTGTHDNDTVLNWFYTLDETIRNSLSEYLNYRFPNDDISTAIIKYSLEEPAELSVISILDLLKLKKGRFNTPGTISKNNWSTRIKSFNYLLEKENEITDLLSPYINK